MTDPGPMAKCLVCCEEAAPGKSKPGLDRLCPTCGLLLGWFRGRFEDMEEMHVIESIDAETTFLSLAIDSLDYIEWLWEAEESFGIAIPDAVAEKLITVGAYLRFIRDRVPAEKLKSILIDESRTTGPDPLWDRDLDG